MSSQPSPPPTYLLILFLISLPALGAPLTIHITPPTLTSTDNTRLDAETTTTVREDPPGTKDRAVSEVHPTNATAAVSPLDLQVLTASTPEVSAPSTAAPDATPPTVPVVRATVAVGGPGPLPSSVVSFAESLDEDVVDVEGPHGDEGLDALDENGSYYMNTSKCTNDYCIPDDDYYLMIENHVWPTGYEWFLIALHAVVFAVGLVGNALVCAAVRRNHSMRTVTNYFIVNLAVADFMVILFCLPPTVAWDVTETWFMGTALCKVVLYFQTVSVAVSVLTLTFISVDRWYAICFPLKFKSTTGRAKTAILVIWFVALCFDIPELVVLKAQPKELRIETILLTQCIPSWSGASDMTFTVAKSILLYTVPLIFMSVAYCQIVRVLWRSANIPGHTEARATAAAMAAASEAANRSGAGCTCSSSGSAAIRCCFHQGGHCSGRQQSSNNGRGLSGGASSRHTTSSVGGTVLITNANASTEGQLRSRRKAAKMLVAVVLMFAVCYFPVHLLGIIRYMVKIPQTDEWVALSMISHWLCYANSAVNPVIYNFMSGKFRKEFRRTFCFWWRRRPRDRAQVGRRINGSIMDKRARVKKGGWRVTGWLKGRQRGGNSTRHASSTTAHSRGSSYYKSLFRSTLRHNTNGQRSAMATEYEDFEVNSSFAATARTEVLPLSRLGSATIMVVEVD